MTGTIARVLVSTRLRATVSLATLALILVATWAPCPWLGAAGQPDFTDASARTAACV